MLSTPLRSSLAVVTTKAERDLDGLWRQVDTAVAAKEALKDVLPSLVTQYGTAAATLASVWYDDLRAKQGVRGSFESIPADLGDSGAVALAGWGVSPLFSAEPDWAAAQTLIAGGLQRRIVNYSRATVTNAATSDPKALGWRREGLGGCDFCAELVADMTVRSGAAANFVSHDHCHCQAVPAFD